MIKFSCNSGELKSILAEQVSNSSLPSLFPVSKGWRIVFPEYSKRAPHFLSESLAVSDGNSVLIFVPSATLFYLDENDLLEEASKLGKPRELVLKPNCLSEIIIVTDDFNLEKTTEVLEKIFLNLPLLSFETERPRFVFGSFKDERLNFRLGAVDFHSYATRREITLPVLYPKDIYERKELLERFFSGLLDLAYCRFDQPDFEEISAKAYPYWDMLKKHEQQILINEIGETVLSLCLDYPKLTEFITLKTGKHGLNIHLSSFDSDNGKYSFLKLVKKILEELIRGSSDLKLSLKNSSAR